jgi:mannosyl-oligosaccharide glucosidase
MLNETFPVKDLSPLTLDFRQAREIIRMGVSNLLGGILYSYGKVKILHMLESEIEPRELLTASPSRLGFPRGFLWDEGFHQ